ncbi:hypothetical protein DB347_00865 [Opitutaceae bacterium EW11]|nr:hypothetical protein DB347_00865 [Opitutaceae bacterium EW11]
MLLGESRPIASEQELKAAALYQVLHFTRWPPERMGAPDSPLVVGVFGENRFAPLLQELVKQEKVSGHPVIITRCFTVESAAACHAVFVSGAEDRTTERLLAHMQGRGVLTVGDNELFAERGGSVCLTVRDDRIRVLVNLGAARRDGIVLSSKLLRLAEIVEK